MQGCTFQPALNTRKGDQGRALLLTEMLTSHDPSTFIREWDQRMHSGGASGHTTRELTPRAQAPSSGNPEPAGPKQAASHSQQALKQPSASALAGTAPGSQPSQLPQQLPAQAPPQPPQPSHHQTQDSRSMAQQNLVSRDAVTNAAGQAEAASQKPSGEVMKSASVSSQGVGQGQAPQASGPMQQTWFTLPSSAGTTSAKGQSDASGMQPGGGVPPESTGPVVPGASVANVSNEPMKLAPQQPAGQITFLMLCLRVLCVGLVVCAFPCALKNSYS